MLERSERCQLHRQLTRESGIMSVAAGQPKGSWLSIISFSLSNYLSFVSLFVSSRLSFFFSALSLFLSFFFLL
jgi:hypothetical protein